MPAAAPGRSIPVGDIFATAFVRYGGGFATYGLMALASAHLSPELRTSGLAFLTTATSLSRLLSSVLFGLLWTWWSMEMAVVTFLLALVGGLLAAAALLARMDRSATNE